MRYDYRHALNLNIPWIRLMQINRCYTPIKGFKDDAKLVYDKSDYVNSNQIILQNAMVRNDMLCWSKQ